MNDKTKMDVEREAFEAWADDEGFCLDCRFFDGGNNYESADTGVAFEAWQARASLPVDGVVVSRELLGRISSLLGADDIRGHSVDQLRTLLASHEQQENGNE